MRKILLCLTVALAIAGCAADQQDAQDPSSKTPRAQTGSPGMPTSILASTAAKRAVFASLPDHGALLAYERGQQPIRRGAQTYHAVQLSEAHALNAAAPGKSIELPTPSGGTMHIDYLRHEEGLDGNWSWVGKTADGLDAVITFGESAVFGRIAQRDTEALRVTMSAGRTWLVESDPGKMLDGNLGRASDEPDVLIPSNVAAAVSAKKRSTAAMVAAGDEAASAANTVDVVLGFTNGLVTKYGSVANANTRLSNLVAITNQGYVNSLVTPRIRLVRTVQVSYTDTNSNDTALEAVTGFTCTGTGCTAQTVPTELVPLRTARDTYGGDLVSLVRPFQAPQHQGCGIAWLLGGGGFTIDNTDAPFGYSVISDGTDVDETDGRTYFCREETLSHELGHNMGQQHNIEDAGTPPDPGTHSYSYGYREATTTGFYTVMAYRLANSSQFSINYFGNPSVNYADTGRPTGAATADNARSLNLSMPLVVQFRNSVVPFGGRVPNDINGDGRSDLALRNFGVERFTYFNMNGAAYTTGSYDYMVNTYGVATSGDYNGDGRADFVWRNDTARVLYMWFSTAGGFVQQFVSGFPAGWQIVGSGDVNLDGKDDILWRNSATEQFSYWVMNGAQITSSAAFYMVNTYSVATTGDFNGDGRTDVVWLRPGFNIYMGLANAAGGYDLQFVANHTNGWAIAGAVDIDADGKDDLVMRNFANEQLRYMIMNGAQTVRQQDTYFVNTYNVAGLGDYNGDGYGDIMWVRPGFNVYLWRGNGTSFELEYVTNLASVWSIVPASNL